MFFYRSSVLFIVALSSAQSFAQMQPPPVIEAPDSMPVSSSSSVSSGESKPKEDDENVIKLKRDTESPAAIKIFTETERRKVCAKYNGKYISVFGDVFKVDKCVRHPVVDSDLLFKLQRTGIHFIEVESKEVAPIQIGETISSSDKIGKRHCKELNGHYVTQSYTDIYYIENCTKRLIPDYETFVELKRQKKHSPMVEVLALSSEEFEAIRGGKDYDSVVDRKENSERPAKKGVDIIPVDEACKGIEGKTVSFYSKLYKVEKCRKRELDAEEYSKNFYRNPQKLVELTPEQWISLPDGAPVKK